MRGKQIVFVQKKMHYEERFSFLDDREIILCEKHGNTIKDNSVCLFMNFQWRKVEGTDKEYSIDSLFDGFRVQN